MGFHNWLLYSFYITMLNCRAMPSYAYTANNWNLLHSYCTATSSSSSYECVVISERVFIVFAYNTPWLWIFRLKINMKFCLFIHGHTLTIRHAIEGKIMFKWFTIHTPSNLLTYLIFSSGVPLVKSTRPHNSSLNAIPFCVPPQATYNQSANTDGMPSDRTSCRKATLLNDEPFDPDDFLNDSLMRRNSLCVTGNEWKQKNN